MMLLEQYEVRVPVPDELEAVRQLRHEVLDPARSEDYELTLGRRDFDQHTIHAAAFVGEKVVSTVRFDLLDDGQTYEVRKMATAEQFRRMGIGGRVFRLAEEQAIARGAKEIILDSRAGAEDFYRELGYESTGEEVNHGDGQTNYRMKKQVL
jgi:predicted N-acetyltransferase YhbS